jgi:hypothetical protein
VRQLEKSCYNGVWTDWREVAHKDDLTPAQGAGSHNAVYRGKYLGNAVTDAQYAAITAGSFDDLFIGDYWTIGGVNYRIAAFDYFYRSGDAELTKHHVVIVPDTSFYNAQMNSQDVAIGGYAGSLMRTTNLANAKDTINDAFPGHVLTHRQYFTTGVAASTGIPITGAWSDSSVEIMSEIMVYGSYSFAPTSSPTTNGTTIPVNYTISKSQLPLFSFRPDLISNRISYWLRDIVSAQNYANVNALGYTYYNGASTNYGVRPAFSIFGA